jgi:RNA polymerase sigma factor (sigma-70 family)
MKSSNYEGLNDAQEFFYGHLPQLLAPLKDFREKIDFEELEQVVAFDLRLIKDEKFANLKDPLAYLFKITKFKAIDLYRQTMSRTGNGRQVSFNDYQLLWLPDKPGTNPEETMMANLDFAQLWRRCNKEERQLLEMIFDGLSPQQIAKEIGISAETVRQRKSRLFKKLRNRNPP